MYRFMYYPLNPYKIITRLNLGIFQKFEMFLVLKGYKKVSRIDIFTCNDSKILIKAMILAMGLNFEEMSTTGSQTHVCGMAIAKTKYLCDEFVKAVSQKDYITVKRLTAVTCPLPLTDNRVWTELNLNDAGSLYYEMKSYDLIAA